MYFLTNYSWKI